MNLIDRDKVLKTIPSEEMVARMAVMSAPVVDAIPVDWIDNYICDLNTGKQTHHLDADEYISNSDEVYYLRYLLKKWKQEKQNGTD